MPRSPVPNAIADAFERKLRTQREQAAAAPTGYSDFDDNHEKRQNFRRLIDPGIMRPNPRHIALESLHVHASHAFRFQEVTSFSLDTSSSRGEYPGAS